MRATYDKKSLHIICL